jgi:hypothetical protein
MTYYSAVQKGRYTCDHEGCHGKHMLANGTCENLHKVNLQKDPKRLPANLKENGIDREAYEGAVTDARIMYETN